MEQTMVILSAFILVAALSTRVESRSISANGLIFSDDLDPELLPCRSWTQVCDGETTLEDPVERCTSPQVYAWHQYGFFGGNTCPLQQQQSNAPTVSPSKCAMVGETCSFSETLPTCVQSCSRYTPMCTTLNEYFENLSETSLSCSGRWLSTDVCVPEDEGCVWHNPCSVWQQHCSGEYTCGTRAAHAKFNTEALPPCAPPLYPIVPSPPPGECLYLDGQCQWSECRSWLSACGTKWMCGTSYDVDRYFRGPLPSCAYNPFAVIPMEPGRCEYSLEEGECAFKEVSCPKGMEMQECGTACPETCDGPMLPNPLLLFCPTHCVRGCFCPQGSVLHEGRCIQPDQCPPQLPPRKG